MTRPLPPHSDTAHAAITAELQRLTLPHHVSTDRPELERTVTRRETILELRRRSPRLPDRSGKVLR